eukprot:13015381-Heterocapsa_arctica.AAC.1
MRHLNRTHRVNLAWLSEVFRKCEQVHIAYCNTNEQAADLLTKVFTSPLVWERVRSLIAHPKTLNYFPGLCTNNRDFIPDLI